MGITRVTIWVIWLITYLLNHLDLFQVRLERSLGVLGVSGFHVQGSRL